MKSDEIEAIVISHKEKPAIRWINWQILSPMLLILFHKIEGEGG
jgi:hypothetical protein